MSCILAGFEYIQEGGTQSGMYIDDDFIGSTHRSCFAGNAIFSFLEIFSFCLKIIFNCQRKLGCKNC